MVVPNTADEVHRNKARGEVFDKMPATMELLQKVSTGIVDVTSR